MVDLSQKLSQHFTLSEFVTSQTASRRQIANIPDAIAIDNLKLLCMNVLQKVRDHFGPVTVSSGYRSPSLNKAVGGSTSSQHMKGEAADIEVPGVANVDLARWIAANCPFDQLILEFHVSGQPHSGWVHVSYAKGANRRQTLTITAGGTRPGLIA